MVECQDLTDTAIPKSQETMLCTDTNTGKISAESRMPAMICSFHVWEFPANPWPS